MRTTALLILVVTLSLLTSAAPRSTAGDRTVASATGPAAGNQDPLRVRIRCVNDHGQWYCEMMILNVSKLGQRVPRWPMTLEIHKVKGEVRNGWVSTGSETTLFHDLDSLSIHLSKDEGFIRRIELKTPQEPGEYLARVTFATHSEL